MSQENDDKVSRERSPKFPSETLKVSLERVEKLFGGLGRSAAPPETIVKASGFSGLSGASRAALSALGYYGLLIKESGKHKVSELALRIIRPKNDHDKISALWEAVLMPTLFSEIQRDHPDCSESVLAALLLHKGFTEDGAKKAASVFKDSLEFVGSLGYPPKENKDTGGVLRPSVKVKFSEGQLMNPQVITANELPVPIGDNLVARVPFPMSEEDFNLLIGTLNLWKNKLIKQPERVSATTTEEREITDEDVSRGWRSK